MQHQAYQPLLPAGNKYLQQKWDKASYDLHRRKVQSRSLCFECSPSTKKLEEEWAMKIQRENNMLQEKISHIMETTGAVDNRNFYTTKSLSKEKRQTELLRITEENERLLCRLTQCKSRYDRSSWHEDWLKTLKVMDSIARCPRGRANQQKVDTACKLKTNYTLKTVHSAIFRHNSRSKTENKTTKETNREEDAEK
uniref:Si:dkey-83m22.7 n=1 Tax=Salarias fasciatus TaxID=181472 RepID=A0A672I4U4_SALFA